MKVDKSQFRVENSSYLLKAHKKYESLSAAKKAFQSLLRDKRIGPNDAWISVLPKIAGQERYDALKKVEDKKLALREYQEELKLKLKKKKEEKKCVKKGLSKC
ncbi:Huntingtin interacting protein C [Reticulomyxa filosa]|uniref:Huntingtin interacting protein C n=1 Tax=Reticulomyxa filosa TaxID=46433 RepID=X6MV85_RETFI|nr:Huntingtin interacting protein C [Reticulomyxa filosa]|eukprot:ETO17878.1 Huntingtin interacting protein C [Reticulomyxa filosa]